MNYPIVYDKLTTTSDFLGYGLAILENAKDVCIREVINGEYTLKFNLPINDSKWQYIEEENFVKMDGQLFIIRYIGDAHSESLVCTVNCEHVFFSLLDDHIEYLELNGNATYGLNAVLAGTEHTVGSVDVTGTLEEMIIENQNPIKAINTIIGTLGGEIKADNWAVGLLTHRGSTVPNIQFRYRKNIKSITRTIDTSGLITRLYVYGNDGLTIEDSTYGNGLKYIDSQYIDNYRRPKIGSVTFDIDDADELYEAGLKHLAKVEIPYVSYEISVIELKNQAGYGPLEEFGLGDESMAIDEVLGANIQARIIDYERYPLEDERSSVVLANFRPGIQDQLSQLNDVKNTLVTQDGSMKVSTAWFQGAINLLKNQLLASGSYATAQVIEGKGALFENTNITSPDYGAVYIGPGMIAIAKERTGSPPSWNWSTFGTGDGFDGNLLLAQTVKAEALVADTAMVTWLNARNIIAGSVKAENIDTSTATITSAQIGSLAASKIDTSVAKIQTAQIVDLEVGNNVTMGTNATISWAKVSNQPDIPTENDITTISNNCISTATFNANQVNTVGLAAEHIYQPDHPENTLSMFTYDNFFGLFLLNGANHFFSINDLVYYAHNGIGFSLNGTRVLLLDTDASVVYPQGMWNFNDMVVTGLHAQWG